MSNLDESVSARYALVESIYGRDVVIEAVRGNFRAQDWQAVAIIPSAKRGGWWQLQFYDAYGWGDDILCPTKRDAFEEAVSRGYVTIDIGRLERARKGSLWKEPSLLTQTSPELKGRAQLRVLRGAWLGAMMLCVGLVFWRMMTLESQWRETNTLVNVLINETFSPPLGGEVVTVCSAKMVLLGLDAGTPPSDQWM